MSKEQVTKIAGLFRELFTELSTVCGEFEKALDTNATKLKELAEESHKVAESKEDKVTSIKEKTKAENVTVDEPQEDTEETIDYHALSVSQLKEIARGYGLTVGGTKVQLIDRITAYLENLEAHTEEPEEVEEEDVEEVADVNEEEEEDINDIDEEDLEEEELSLAERVEEELKNYTDDEIREVLESVDLSTTGKRQVLLSRVIDAVEQGLLSFEEDEEEYEEEDEYDNTEYDEDGVEDETEVEDDEEEEEYYVEEDEEDDEEEEEEEESVRTEKQQEVMEEIQAQYASKKLTDKHIEKFLDEYFNGTFKAKDKKRALSKYMEIHMECVDEDGELHDFEDPYYVDDVPYCCGAELEELENGNLYCVHCGSEYDTEEE